MKNLSLCFRLDKHIKRVKYMMYIIFFCADICTCDLNLIPKKIELSEAQQSWNY